MRGADSGKQPEIQVAMGITHIRLRREGKAKPESTGWEAGSWVQLTRGSQLRSVSFGNHSREDCNHKTNPPFAMKDASETEWFSNRP